jgi:anhydro-N-acetylmuramic acid kinase
LSPPAADQLIRRDRTGDAAKWVLYLGLISGTSMDAIDAALVDFDASPLRMHRHRRTAFAPALKQRIAAVLDTADNAPLDELGQIDVELARAFAAATLALCCAMREFRRRAGDGDRQPWPNAAPSRRLAAPFTWQIGDPNTLTEMTGITWSPIFAAATWPPAARARRCCRCFHDQVFRSDERGPRHRQSGRHRQYHHLDAGRHRDRLRHRDPPTACSTPGSRCIRARNSMPTAPGPPPAVCDTLLAELLDEPYSAPAPPKSTGRELFNLPWLEGKLGLFARRPQDVQATLQQFTAVTVAAAIVRIRSRAPRYVCGGGAHNAGLLRGLAGRRLAPNRSPAPPRSASIPTTSRRSPSPGSPERTLDGLTSSAGSVTGAAARGSWAASIATHLRMNDTDLQTPQLYINRELSFLEFNQRVLEQAKDSRIPLLERVRFLCISCANLDEFFEIRVASLKELLEAGRGAGGPDGLSGPEQLKAIRAAPCAWSTSSTSC